MNKFEIKHNSAFGTLYTSDDEETKPVLYTDDDIPEGYKVGDTKRVHLNWLEMLKKLSHK